jgi:DNA-binding NtrC family response regulator
LPTPLRAGLILQLFFAIRIQTSKKTMITPSRDVHAPLEYGLLVDPSAARIESRRNNMPQGQTILVVDDDEGLAQIVTLILRQEGFEVRTACDGQQGYTAYISDPTEWVVSDIQMPELDGLQMMRCIRTFNPHVKAIYMSGEVDKYHAILNSEISDFGARVLSKPFTRIALLDQIASAQKTDSHDADSKALRRQHAVNEHR